MLVSVSALKAQKPARNQSAELGWGVAIPLGSDGFLNKTTWTTANAGWEYRIHPKVSAGLSLGWMYADESGITRDRLSAGGVTDEVSGNSHRKLTLVPLQIQVRYFPLGNEDRIQPYLTLAGGAQYADFYISGDQIQTGSDKNVAAVFTPDAGVRFFPVAGSGLYIDARCYWQYAANGWSYTNTGSQQYLGFRVGVGFPVF